VINGQPATPSDSSESDSKITGPGEITLVTGVTDDIMSRVEGKFVTSPGGHTIFIPNGSNVTDDEITDAMRRLDNGDK